MLMGIIQHGWDSRGAANTFSDHLTEWERRIQEYEGESLETFLDGLKIAVMASHALESIRNMVRLAAGPAGQKYRVVRQNMSEFLQFGRIFCKDGRGVESEPSSASATPMDVDAVGKGKGKGCFVCGRPSHAAKDCKLNQGKGKGQGKGKAKRSQPDKNNPAKFEGEFRHCGKKGHKCADCWKRLAEAKDKKVQAVDGVPSTAMVAAVEDTGGIDDAGICGYWSDDDDSGVDTSKAWILSVAGNNMPEDAQFFPLDTACEEHTYPWKFDQGGRDLGSLNVQQLRNANGLSIPSGRKVMVSYHVLVPGGHVTLHAQTPFVQSDVKRPLLSVGKLTRSGAEVKFWSKGSWIDLHTDNGVHRVPVRVKGKTFGLSIQRTNAWIIPETDDAAPYAEVALVDEEIGRGEQPVPAPAAREAVAAPRPEETQGMRLEREAP